MYDIITLSNGTKIGNFNCALDVLFMDKTVLPAIPMILANALLIEKYPKGEFFARIAEWQQLHKKKQVDYVIVLPSTLNFLLKVVRTSFVQESPFRTVYMKDKEKNIYGIDKNLAAM